jgi:hypothetical protein
VPDVTMTKKIIQWFPKEAAGILQRFRKDYAGARIVSRIILYQSKYRVIKND